VGAGGRAGTDAPPWDGIVVELLIVGGILFGNVLAAAEPELSSLTTSRWAITDTGRSITSAATNDVAVQTTAVDAAVTPNHTPAANNRGNDISRACLFHRPVVLRAP